MTRPSTRSMQTAVDEDPNNGVSKTEPSGNSSVQPTPTTFNYSTSRSTRSHTRNMCHSANQTTSVLAARSLVNLVDDSNNSMTGSTTADSSSHSLLHETDDSNQPNATDPTISLSANFLGNMLLSSLADIEDIRLPYQLTIPSCIDAHKKKKMTYAERNHQQGTRRSLRLVEEKEKRKKEEEEQKIERKQKAEEEEYKKFLAQFNKDLAKRLANRPARSKEEMNACFEGLCNVLLPDTGKKYDSDDSLISESDKLTEEEIAAKTKEQKKLHAFMLKIKSRGSQDPFPNSLERVEGLPSNEDQVAAERVDQEKRKKANKKVMKTVDISEESNNFHREHCSSGKALITRRQFQICIEAILDLVPDDVFGRGGIICCRTTICAMVKDDIHARLANYTCPINFSTRPENNVADFLKRKLRDILYKNEISEVFNENLYGFSNFTIRDKVDAIQHYYFLEFDSKHNKNSTDLNISMKTFIDACRCIAKRKDSKFECNKNLNQVLLN